MRRHSLIPPGSTSTNMTTSSPSATSNGFGGFGLSPLHNNSNPNPTISITTEDASPDRSRRPSTHSLGPFSVSGIADFLTRTVNASTSGSSGSGGGGGGSGGGAYERATLSSSSSSHRRPSMAGILPVSPESRRPSMAGILPVSADSRRPSTHSVGILPISMFGEGGEKPRRPSTHSLGVFPFNCFGDDKPERPRRCSTHSLGPLVVPVSLNIVLPRWTDGLMNSKTYRHRH